MSHRACLYTKLCYWHTDHKRRHLCFTVSSTACRAVMQLLCLQFTLAFNSCRQTLTYLLYFPCLATLVFVTKQFLLGVSWNCMLASLHRGYHPPWCQRVLRYLQSTRHVFWNLCGTVWTCWSCSRTAICLQCCIAAGFGQHGEAANYWVKETNGTRLKLQRERKAFVSLLDQLQPASKDWSCELCEALQPQSQGYSLSVSSGAILLWEAMHCSRVTACLLPVGLCWLQAMGSSLLARWGWWSRFAGFPDQTFWKGNRECTL